MRTVQHILDSKTPANNIVSPDMLVIEALTEMINVNLSYLVVMEGKRFKGVFSERDYSRNIVLKGRSSSSTNVSEAMTSDLPKVDTLDTVEHCMRAMILNKSRYLLAFDGDYNFNGVITIHDLLREVIANKEGVFDSTGEELLINDESGFVY